MTVTLRCDFGIPLPLALEAEYADGLELECLHFLGCAPLEWRLVYVDGRATTWMDGLRVGCHENMRSFHDLQRPVAGGTRGTPGIGATLETRGFGAANVVVNLREGTARLKRVLPILEGC